VGELDGSGESLQVSITALSDQKSTTSLVSLRVVVLKADLEPEGQYGRAKRRE